MNHSKRKQLIQKDIDQEIMYDRVYRYNLTNSENEFSNSEYWLNEQSRNNLNNSSIDLENAVYRQINIESTLEGKYLAKHRFREIIQNKKNER